MTRPTPAPDAKKAPYEPPRLARLGAAVDVTKQRAMVGMMDGGANNSRTG